MDVYRIGVSIVMAGNASAFLSVLQKDVMGLHKSVDMLTGKFNAARLAVLGLGTVMAGAGVLGVMAKLVEAGDKLLVIQQRLKAGGASNADVTLLTDVARNTALTTPGTSYPGNLDVAADLKAALGDVADAAAALPSVARSAAALKSANIESFSGPGALGDTLKALDVMGAGLKNGKFDPATYAEAFKSLVQVEMLTNGLLTPSALLQIAKTGGFAAQGIDFQKFLAGELSTFLELGSRAGTGLGMAEMQMVGGNASIKTIAGYKRYHLLTGDPETAYTHEGGHYNVNPGRLIGEKDLLQQGMAYWVTHDLLPQLKKDGVTSAPEIIAALTQITGSIRAARYFMAKATPAGQLMTERDYENAEKAFGSDPYADTQQTVTAQIGDLSTSLETLLTILGGPLMTPAIDALKYVDAELLKVSKWAADNPKLVSSIEELTAELAGLAIAVGAFAIGGAAAKSLGLLNSTTGLLALAAGIAALGKAFPSIPHWLIELTNDAARGAAIGGVAGSIIPGVGTGAGATVGAVAGIGYALSQLATPGGPVFIPDGIGGGVWVPGASAVPPSASSAGANGPRGTPDDPQHVVVQNTGAMTNGVAAGLAWQAARPPVGPTGYDPRMNLLMPGSVLSALGP